MGLVIHAEVFPFVCGHCDYRAQVRVLAMGFSPGGPGVPHNTAELDAASRIARRLRIVICPRCHHQDGQALDELKISALKRSLISALVGAAIVGLFSLLLPVKLPWAVAVSLLMGGLAWWWHSSVWRFRGTDIEFL